MQTCQQSNSFLFLRVGLVAVQVLFYCSYLGISLWPLVEFLQLCSFGSPVLCIQCSYSLLLLLLSHFSHVQLCATPQMAAHQAPPSVGFQARTLEWLAISFSNVWNLKVKMKSLSRVQILAIPWTAAHQGPPSMGFSRQEYWSGVPLPSPSYSLNIFKYLH